MGEKSGTRWRQIRARALADPAARAQYERTYRMVLLTRQLLQAIDAERERAGLTKAELAGRAGTNPAAIRRLLTSDSGNPTLRTVIGVADALGLEISIQARKEPGECAGEAEIQGCATGVGGE
jgi:ribosome-binding protein aMBF1 (putative translation factor)